MIIQPCFHIGIVVDDLPAAMQGWSEATQIGWRDVLDFPMRLTEGERTVEVRLRAVYSAGGPPAIELVEAVPGTCLVPIGTSGLHHVGQWSTNLVADSEALEKAGWPLAATTVDRDGRPKQFVLHRSPAGHFVELVDPKPLAGLFADLVPTSFAESGSRS